MTRVPLDERRRLFIARQQASQALRDQFLAPVPQHPLSPVVAPQPRVRLAIKAVMIAMLLGLGLIAFHTVTFHPPTSVVEALLPPF